MSFSSTVFDIDYTYDEHGNLASSKMLAYISNYDEPMFAQEWTYEYAWIEQPTELVRMYRSPLPIMLYYGRTIRRMALVAHGDGLGHVVGNGDELRVQLRYHALGAQHPRRSSQRGRGQ